MKTMKKIVFLAALLALVAGILAGCNTKAEKTFSCMEDFENARIGILTGSAFDLYANEYYPNAEKVYFANLADPVLNLKQDRIDGFLFDISFFTPFIWENNELSYVEMDMPETEYAVAFSKSPSSDSLRAQMDEFIRNCSENGWLAEAEERWFSSTEPDVDLDFDSLSGENGTLRVATAVDNKPFDYLKNGKFYGFDAEIVFAFAKEYGYAIELHTMDFGALLPGISAERYDFAVSGFTVTEERKESVTFSEVYHKSPIVMVTLAKNTVRELSLSDVANGTIGVVTGTSWDNVVKSRFPNAERKYFSTETDAYLALEQGKIDTFFEDKTVFIGMKWENSDANCIDEPVQHVTNAFIMAKDTYDEKLLSQINEFIAKSKADGTLEDLDKKWMADSEPTEHPDYTKLEGKNGVLKIAVGDSHKPLTYKKGNLYSGHDVEFLTLFAEEYGYALDIEGMLFDAIIPAVSSGKFDIGAAGITITPERAESVTFTDSHFETYGVAVVKSNSFKKAAVSGGIQSEEELENGTIAILTGSILDVVAKERLPEAQLKYFATIPDMILSLSQGKADAMIGDETFYLNARWEGVPVRSIGNPAGEIPCGIILKKDNYNKELFAELNEFIARIKEDGTADRLIEKWISETEPKEFPDYTSLTGERGTLKVAVNDTGKPMTYVKDDGFTGFDIEVITEFAREYGYSLEISGMAFDAVIPTISSGKCDIGICGIAITPEREESVTFTDVYIEKHGMFIVYDDVEPEAKSTFFEDVKESFEKTFIREDRWKLIAEGIKVTMIISIFAAIIGSLFGFGLYMLGRSDIKFIKATVKGISSVYSRIISGTPIVVILMILFYVVFGKFRDMSGIVVAIIGFALTFGAFVYDHMTVSVASVNFGQTEAAYALGYGKNRSFFRIVFPQAMTIFLPSYCGEVVSLIKATAVVGYIAVNDLTKMGDIIRSNTYEAFFPLISTAVIYFILTWIIASLLNIVKMKFEPRRRSEKQILKGVKR